MKSVDQLKVQIFADGADKVGMLEMYAKPFIKGFTTNPTLMRKAGIPEYEVFAREILAAIPDRQRSSLTISPKWNDRPAGSLPGESMSR
jgi:transaldolase